MTSKKLILYHADCMDGFGAAWAACTIHGPSLCELQPVYHGNPPPEISGRDVMILDFCYPREILLKLKEQSKSLIVIDHHKTAYEDCGDLDFCHFDMNESGASLTWKHFIPNNFSSPKLIQYIRDIDLNKYELPYSKQVRQIIKMVSRTYDDWTKLSSTINNDLDSIVKEGLIIVKANYHHVIDTIKSTFDIELNGIKGKAINETYDSMSETLNYILEKFPESNFALGFYFNGSKWKYSLRSEDRRIDVGALAKTFGGGGHRNASGFELDELICQMKKI